MIGAKILEEKKLINREYFGAKSFKVEIKTFIADLDFNPKIYVLNMFR